MLDTPQEMDQPPRVRWGLLLAFVGVSALIAVVLLVLVVWTTGSQVVDASGGPELPRAERDEIARANCRQLTIIEARHTQADSVKADSTALRLTRERRADLHCS